MDARYSRRCASKVSRPILNITECANLSTESVKYLVENLQRSTGKTHLTRRSLADGTHGRGERVRAESSRQGLCSNIQITANKT